MKIEKEIMINKKEIINNYNHIIILIIQNIAQITIGLLQSCEII